MTKEVSNNFTRLYKSDEELRQLKVLAMVFKKFDLKRLSDVALNVLQVNPDNLVANTAYNLDIKKVTTVGDIAFNDFNTVVMEKFFKRIIESNAEFDDESKIIIADMLCGFSHLLSEHYECDQNLPVLLLKCFKSIKPDNASLAVFYKTVLIEFCNPDVISTLSNYATYDNSTITGENYYAVEITKTRRNCLITLKQQIQNETAISEDTKRSLTAQIDNTGLSAPAPSQPAASQQPQNRKIAYIGAGIFVVVAFIFFICLFL